MSRHILSVPKMCSLHGGSSASIREPFSGSTPPVINGAKIAARIMQSARIENTTKVLFCKNLFFFFMILLLQTHTRIDIDIRCIHDQVDYHIDQCKPQYVSLNQVVITRGDCRNCKITKARLGKNNLHNAGSSKKRTNGKTEHGDQRKQRIREYIEPDNF